MTIERISIRDAAAPVRTVAVGKDGNGTGPVPPVSAVRPADTVDRGKKSFTLPDKGTSQLQKAENKVRSMEQALRAQGGRYVSSVSYRYVTGPDGKKYIVGAEVSISAPQEIMEELGLTGGTPERIVGKQADKAYGRVAKTYEILKKSRSKDSAIEQEVERLERTDREVRAHEAAHQTAGGAFTSMATYEYVKGPDGKNYAVAGKVPIAVPSGGTSEETIRMMDIVKSSALAPGSPSGKDLSVAAEADNNASRAKQEIARRQAEKAYSPFRDADEGLLSMVA
ncbi:putative metalloprotease CJM1_0395 family protein [Dethiosulfovibrio salsuginis]|uniref:SprA-related family protein n=1 Tax=Dethiosulfovibrio salsuginis TaxID=561720 RepID=A0A1X7IYN1_9BACT|nr:putative metalloprotease CJM1_0395 family protein [Dethiosulfovibrio salsuginis]SMG19536.1 SprA-related family protein [Dethiosulfovibrio salsuginis]